MSQQPSQQQNVNVQVVVPTVVVNRKSVGLAILLTFLFGPLGMLYSTVIGAILMFFVSIVVAVVTLGLGLLVTWPICIIWAGMAAARKNTRAAIVIPAATQVAGG